ncbi:MAG TPA: biosynthetic peptidoglycan transglycosylase, partial [Kofleriaceae bacterium]|nr:biosynthetic peptidoglycan transglycosylase [Kofleriaceae bacterium]
MRFRPGRVWIVLGAVVAGLGVCTLVGLRVVYPRVGAWYIRSRVLPRLEHKLGVKLQAGTIDVRLGHATIRALEVVSDADGPGAPLAHLDRIDIGFATWPSFLARARVGLVAIHGGRLAVHRNVDGGTNLDLLRQRFSHGAHGLDRGGGGLGSMRPKEIEVDGIAVTADDAMGELQGSAAEVSVHVAGDDRVLTVDKPMVATVLGPRAGAARVVVHERGDHRDVTITGGAATPWKGMALTGITGTLADGSQPGRLQVDLAGGYGGVEAGLWTAKGWVDPDAAKGQIDLVAEQFSLDKLRPLLEGRGRLVDYQKTTVDAALTITIDGAVTDFTGNFHLRDLTVAHPMLAEQPVRGLELTGEVRGSFDRRARTLALTRGDFESRGLPFSITGQVALPGGVTAGGGRRPRTALSARLQVPPVPCQQVLDAVPRELARYISDLRAKGTFSSDLHVAIDWSDLDATDLDGSVGLRGCKIAQLPDAIARLDGPFEHLVEVEPDVWDTITIGPGSPGFVPLAEVSPYLPLSLMTTEDSQFYSHHGFLPREFKSALVKDLKAGYFKYGASSITMQTVKNVLLYQEKTLSRKLQELVLTWAIEQALDKDRIMEIYINAIEYGPGIYGIGTAAQHYFGKSAHDLTPKESAFFSSILPSPKQRYRQYCAGQLTSWSADKIDRILATMLKRGRLTQAEYDAAIAQPLVFVKDTADSEEACEQRIARALGKLHDKPSRADRDD